MRRGTRMVAGQARSRKWLVGSIELLADVSYGSGAEISPRTRHVRFAPKNRHLHCTSACPLWSAGSTDRRNTCVKSLCWGFKPQGLTRPLVELACHFVQVSLRVDRQVSSFRKVLSQQTIGVLIGTALPRTLRIAEVNIDIGR